MVSAEVAALCTGLARADALCHRLGQGFPPWVLLVGIFTAAPGSHFSHWWELWSVCQCSPACVSSFGLCMFLSLITHVCACPFNLETTGTGTELPLELFYLFFLFLFPSKHWKGRVLMELCLSLVDSSLPYRSFGPCHSQRSTVIFTSPSALDACFWNPSLLGFTHCAMHCRCVFHLSRFFFPVSLSLEDLLAQWTNLISLKIRVCSVSCLVLGHCYKMPVFPRVHFGVSFLETVVFHGDWSQTSGFNCCV